MEKSESSSDFEIKRIPSETGITHCEGDMLRDEYVIHLPAINFSSDEWNSSGTC
jgi:hypothetical protein